MSDVTTSQPRLCWNCAYWRKDKADGPTDTCADVDQLLKKGWAGVELGTCTDVDSPWLKTGWFVSCEHHTTADELKNYLAELQVAVGNL